MMKTVVGFLVLSLAASSSMAEVDCSNGVLKNEQVHQFPGAGYWMQSLGDCRMTYTGIGGLGSAMYNLCERKKEPMTWGIDGSAVPGTKGKVYAHPTNGISFYRTADTIRNGEQNQPFYSDPELQGNYQSIGVLNGGDDTSEKDIRVSMGNRGGLFRDYHLKEKRNGDYDVNPVGETRKLCQNIPSGGLDTEVPILSRNGTMIAGRELDSRKTKVFKIDNATGNCTELFTIPTSTSKVSFSFSNKHVAYKIMDPNTNKGRLMEIDLDTKKIKTVSGPDEDVMYMSYKPDGTLMYTRRPSDSSDTSYYSDSRSDLILMKSDMIPNRDTSGAKSAEALGFLWANACNKQLDADYAAAVGARLDRRACETLVNDQGVAGLSDEYKSLPKESLLAFCQSTGADRQGSPVAQ